jgi:predicted nucleic acid-binding protein
MGNIKMVVSHLSGKRVYFDTNPIIYFINQSEGYFELCLELFDAIDTWQFQAFSGDICLAELLVKPIRDNDPLQVRNIKALFDEGFFSLLTHTREVLELTAEIRATQHLKMADAMHAATALYHQCDFIITADKGISGRLRGIEVIDLNDYL